MATQEQTLTDADFSKSQTITDADFAPVSTGKPMATVSQPPVQMQTTYLPDVDKSVDHPADMSHDQVNDAVQTDIYGRPRTKWFDPAEAPAKVMQGFKDGLAGFSFDLGAQVGAEEPKAIPETGKAVVRGTEAIPAQVGGLLKWFGDNLEDQAKYNDSEFGIKLGKATAQVGERARQFWQERQAEGWEAPDPEVFRGAFLSNPSFTRLAANVAQGIPILAAAGLVGHAALAAGISEGAASLLGAGGLGFLQGGETYAQAKEHGKDNAKASRLAGISTIGNTILTALPFGRVLSKSGGKSIARNALEGAFGFSAATGALVPFNNIIAKLGGDKARKLFDGMTEAILAAAVSGGVLGGFTPGHGQMVDSMIQEAHNAGVSAKDIDAAREAIANHMIENAPKIEKAISEHFEPSAGRSKEELQSQFDKFLDPKDITTGSEKDIKAIRENIVEVMKAYDQATMKEYGTSRPVVSSSDLAKTMELPFREKFTSEDSVNRHAAASAVSKIFDEERLNDPAFKDNSTLIMAGVSGAGKTTVVKFAKLNLDQYSLVKDTNLNNLKAAQAILDKMIESGHEAHFMLVDRDIVEAFTDGVFKRFQKREEHRIVPVEIHLKNAAARDVFPVLAAKNTSEKTPFTVWKSESGFDPRPVGVEEIRPLGYTLDEARKEILDFLKQKYEEKTEHLNESAYQIFRKGVGGANEQNSAASPGEIEFHAIGGGAEENQYVKFEPFKIRLGKNDDQTARNIRNEFTGQKNSQIVRGHQLAEEIKRILPSKLEREGLFWFKAADGDMNKLVDALDNPKFAEHKDAILSALRSSEQQKLALQKINKYYEESGQVGKESGTLKATRENYMARLYSPDKPQDFVKNETSSGIKPSTSHAKHRVFDTEFEAIEAGKNFASTDVAETLPIHNEEMARANTSRRMADSMVENGLGAWKKDIPDGWAQVGTLEKNVPIKNKETGEAVLDEEGNQAVSHSKFVAPKGIAEALKAIAEPNFAKKIDSLREIQKYQGLVKTVDLSFSFFHHLTMAAQTLYQGGVRTLMHLPMMEAHLNSPEFGELEQDFTSHTGMTSKVAANQDILRNLTENNPDTFSKITNLPGVKQILDQANANAEYLFGHIQRYLKVSDYGQKISDWVAKNQDADNEQVRLAKIGFAKEINAAYGGLNWESMGMTKSNLSLLRIGLLAPDWTISNAELLRYAIGDNPFTRNIPILGKEFEGIEKTATKSAQAHILTALIGGMVLTEGINKILTGHFTDKNKKGHQLEIEIAPNVYVSMLRGGIGDITKLGSMMAETGPIAGMVRFGEGKLAPFPRTAIGLIKNQQYTGHAIYKNKEGAGMITYDVLKYLLSSLAPVPFGVSNLYRYMNDAEKNWVGGAAVATGVGRYSVSGKKKQSGSLL